MLTFLIPLGQVAKRLALPIEIGLRALGRLGFCGVEQPSGYHRRLSFRRRSKHRLLLRSPRRHPEEASCLK